MNIGLFMTMNIGLKDWENAGLFEREVRYYNELLRHPLCEELYIFTYDYTLPSSIVTKLPPKTNIVLMPRIFKIFWKGSGFLYSLLLPFCKFNVIKQLDIMKSNQTLGAWSALLAAKVASGKFVYRAGYLTSSLLQNQTSTLWNKFKGIIYLRIEKFLSEVADLIIVSSSHNFQSITDHRSISDRTRIINNSIDTKYFHNVSGYNDSRSFSYVGRLSHEKNVQTLLDAMVQLGENLTVVGTGPEERSLVRRYADSPNIKFLGAKPPSEVKKVLAEHGFFLNVSFHEGMPKSLLEAMAMGCICICTPTSAALELVEDGVNGFVATDFSRDSIRDAVVRAINSSSPSIRYRARETVCKSYDKALRQNESMKNMSDCLVTILLSAYNAEDTIRDCLVSIREQTSSQWCVVFVDDASNDNTWSIVSEMCKGDARFKLIRNEANQGLTKNLYSMVRNVETEFIARIDADDTYLPTKIENQINFMVKNPSYVLCATGFYVIQNGKKLVGKRYSNECITQELFSGNKIVHGTALFRKSAGLNYRTHFKYSQDFDLWLRLTQRGEVAVIPEPLYNLTKTKNSISAKNRRKQYFYAMLALSQSRKLRTEDYFAKALRKWYIFIIAIKSVNFWRGFKLIF